MSKIKIVGHASGSGVLTIAAPNTNTDRTITIPDVTGTLLDSGSDLPAANLTGTIAGARFPSTLPAASATNLTAIPAANLSGILPAIDASNLTSVRAVNSGRKNIVINGGMRIDQRNGTDTINATGVTYNVDRWLGRGVSSAGVFTLTQDTNSPANFTNSLKATVTTADGSIGSSSSYRVQHVIEGNNAANLNWGTSAAQSVTLSFWVRSSVTGTFGGSVANGDYNRFNPYSYTISSANTWEYKTVTIAGDTSGTWATNSGLGIRINWSLGAGSSKIGTAGTWTSSSLEGVTGQTNLIATNSATFYLTGVQFETGSAATNFEHRSFGEELALCQRYFQRISGGGDAFTVSGKGQGSATIDGTIPLPVSLRSAPTMSSINSRAFGDSGSFASSSATPVANMFVANDILLAFRCGGFSGLTNNEIYAWGPLASVLTLDSEL